jgi:hypothetical protein
MRRLIAGVLVTVAASAWATAGFAQTTRVKNDLVGPVRSVTIKKVGYSATETYDRAGRLVETFIDLTHANTSTYSLFQYDKEGHLQEELALDPSGRLMQRKRVVYVQDSEGRDTASVAVSDDGHFQHAEFSVYDQRGHLWEQLWVNSTTAYKSLFDVFGRRIYSARYSKGALFSELKHQYDERGRLQELVSYGPQGAVTGRVTNAYDADGRRVQATTEIFSEDQRRTWITTYEYDDMGNWIKETTAEHSPASHTTTASTVPIVQERAIQYYAIAENKVH